MMQKGNKSSGQQDTTNESTLPTRPLKLQLELLEKIVHHGTDVMSFKFARGDASGNRGSQQKQYLNYKAGQYSILNLGTKDDPEGPVRSFTIASSPAEKGFINTTMLQKYLNSSEIESSIFYICGPPAMITTMKDLLQNELTVPKERIKIEEFTGY
jgi:ferredoxin-NADP reductase